MPPPAKILIVDDEPLARATLRCLLAKDTEIGQIAECVDGAQAVERIRSDDPDLVFLDISMPGLGGFEVLDALGDERRAAIVFPDPGGPLTTTSVGCGPRSRRAGSSVRRTAARGR